ncbi:cell wall hydrolase [Acetivibrio cellulolyticus]|uniref:cell wall hydrolase n=1 Tax=Acetivibrio cellulolyticus TaxID=35830 RepID=UPI0001E2F119|nr:cell wall hydrolase [Acetivibrio cellulolyticus]
MPFTARELLARLIKCEAGGEGMNGMKAVANVVMNRVHASYGEYLRVCQGDLRKVVFQPYQFTCVMDTVYGEVNPQTIWATPPEDIHYEVADWALAGNELSGIADCLWYYNPFSPSCSDIFPSSGTGEFITRVNQHCFYNPTPLYAET